MASGRIRRVDEAVRAVLGDAISKDLQDPRVGFVTVTGVNTSPDLRQARVYVSVLGDEQEREDSLEGLRSAHGFLQARVATELRLKHTPTLTFAYDESVQRGMRITELLNGALAQQGASAPQHQEATDDPEPSRDDERMEDDDDDK
jgi:ribosome-binding factor A